MKNQSFTVPKVVKYDDLETPWYVYFRYNGKKIVYKKGINYIKDLKKRLSEANGLANALHDKLKKGWNPLIPDIFDTSSEMTLLEALDFALEKKKDNLAPKTYLGYRGSVDFIKTAIEALSLNYLPVADAKRIHIKTILEKVKAQRKASNNSYNKYLDHFRAVLSELIQWDILQFNPANNIKNLPVPKSRANIPGTEREINIIAKELNLNHYNYWVFVLTIFFTGIRPEEILKLKLDHINLENNEIIIPAELTKTNIERVVPINPHFKIFLEKMNFENLPKYFYLFGSFRESGKGNVGGKLDFIPGPTKLKRDTATKRWHKIVKEDLGIDMNMYAMKKYGANKMILAGVSIEAIKDLFGHTSEVTTQIYITNLKELNRKQILENAPSFN